MWRRAISLAGDSFPKDAFVETALRSRLESLFSEWIGQTEFLARSGEARFVRDVGARVALLEPHAGSDTILFGRSSGARVATLFAMRGTVAGVVCLGYPFRNPKAGPELERVAHLARLAVPTLIMQGLRDPYGNRNVGRDYGLSPAVTLSLHDANHEWEVQASDWDGVAEVTRAFLDRIRAA